MNKNEIPSPPYRPVPASQCYLAYSSALLAGIASWWVLFTFQLIEDVLWIGLVVTCVCTIVIWLFSIKNGNSSIYDPYWVIAPPFLAIALKSGGGGGLIGPWNIRQVLVLACLVIWAGRYHIFYRWSGWRTGLKHEDWRYEQMREFPLPYWLISLLGMHLFPTVLVYFAFTPAALVMGSNPLLQPAFNLLDVLGLVGALLAVAILFFSDEQLRKFRLTTEYRRGGIYSEGLWKYSRHPNYFGEVLFWLSMIPFAVAAGMLSSKPVHVFAGPILMALFFRFSAWMMDKRSLKHRQDYQHVMDRISPLVPWSQKE
jgi:steroid 5-alpha reductase family enzyme